MNATEWIAQCRELLDAATEGPWLAGPWLVGDDWEGATVEMPDDGSGGTVIIAADMHQGPTEGADDAEFIADARTSLPRALDALEAVLKGHRPVSFSFSWRDGVTMHEACPACQDRAGTHPCGCWRDEDQPHVCAVCSDPEHRMDVPWPCMTVQTIESALRGDRDDHV